MRFSTLCLSSLCLFCLSLSAHATFGGISGGGGNVLDPTYPADPLDAESTQQMIRADGPTVLDYLRRKESLYRSGQMKALEAVAYSPLFDSVHDVASAVRGLHVHVDDQRPCFDRSSQVVDGSSVHAAEGSICISALRIAVKVEAQRIPAESAALLVHEYSEAVGLAEDQAVQLQQSVLVDWPVAPLAPLK